MGKLLKMQPSLLHVAAKKDIVYTPEWIARDMVDHFYTDGVCLDPCFGGGAFFKFLPAGSEWCEIEKGVDFYAYTKQVKWIISNPPYSHLLAWIRHSFSVAENIVYLMPVHRVFSSAEFCETCSIGAVWQRFGCMARARWQALALGMRSVPCITKKVTTGQRSGPNITNRKEKKHEQ